MRGEQFKIEFPSGENLIKHHPFRSVLTFNFKYLVTNAYKLNRARAKFT